MPTHPTIIVDDAFFPPEEGRIYGIHSASQEFLKAFIKHSAISNIEFMIDDDTQKNKINTFYKGYADPAAVFSFKTTFGDFPQCAMFYMLPKTAAYWHRLEKSTRRYSICGINHTLSGAPSFERLRDIVLAPTRPWDAIICTSQASRQVILSYFQGWSNYIRERTGAALPVPLALPVIPLGVDAKALAIDGASRKAGQALRDRLGIGPKDLAVLFLGRLTFHSKANPFPMYLALQEAQARLGAPLHLILAGWYPSKEMEAESIRMAKQVAPSVTIHHLGGVSGAARLEALAAGDLFISLSDNIQETFGLTLIEAMAAGLPVVASDWDGYRDTVEHGTTGFLAPTLMAAPGHGADLGRAHGFMGRIYNRYLVDVAQATAVDIASVTDAVVRLAQDADLRQRMGAAGRRRVERLFDWPVIIAAYRDLWQDLNAIRQAAAEPSSVADPLHPDPFALFASFPNRVLEPTSRLQLHDDWRNRYAAASGSQIMRLPSDRLLPGDWIGRILARLDQQGPQRTCDLLQAFPVPPERMNRALVWIVKAGVAILVE